MGQDPSDTGPAPAAGETGEPAPELGRELSGLLVVSLEQAVAAPYCGLLLADAGARVVKVERREGDFARAYDGTARGHSAYFVWLNRGKQSIILDIDDADDLALLKRMLAKADVLLQNLPPGAVERRGLSGDALRKDNPGLVTCEITGYGRTGAHAQMKAYDLLVQAESGLCAVTGTAEAPARVGLSICDIATGLTAFSAILRALLLRARTGRGVDLSVSMFDVLADWMNVPLLTQRYRGAPPARLGVAHPSLAPYGLYRAAGGEELLIAIQSNREWRDFCARILHRPELGEDARFRDNEDRVRNRAEMDRHIAEEFSRHAREALCERLQAARIAYARLNTVADLMAHPQLRTRLAELEGTDITLADLPVRASGAGPHVPALDEHAAALRAEFATTSAASAITEDARP